MYVIRPIQIKLEKKSVSIPDHSDLRWQLASVRIKLMETGMTANESTPARFTTSEQVAPTGAQAAVTPVLVPHPQAPVASRGAAFHIGTATHARSELREAVARATRIPEAESLSPLLALARPGNERAARTDAIARQLINTLRTQPAQGGRAGRHLGLPSCVRFCCSRDHLGELQKCRHAQRFRAVWLPIDPQPAPAKRVWGGPTTEILCLRL
jgi:hypothetical protein